MLGEATGDGLLPGAPDASGEALPLLLPGSGLGLVSAKALGPEEPLSTAYATGAPYRDAATRSGTATARGTPTTGRGRARASCREPSAGVTG